MIHPSWQLPKIRAYGNGDICQSLTLIYLCSTPLHDLTHSWVFNNNNRFKVLQSVALKKGFNLDKENYSSSIDIERPIFYKETVRKFIVDGVCGLW